MIYHRSDFDLPTLVIPLIDAPNEVGFVLEERPAVVCEMDELCRTLERQLQLSIIRLKRWAHFAGRGERAEGCGSALVEPPQH